MGEPPRFVAIDRSGSAGIDDSQIGEPHRIHRPRGGADISAPSGLYQHDRPHYIVTRLGIP